MNYIDKTCREFVESVGTNTPVPGGGSVAALVGALGTSLSTMVATLTAGKKEHKEIEDEMQEKIEEIRQVQRDLLDLVQKDIDNFEPLAQLYKRKGTTPEEKKEINDAKQQALYEASLAPMEIIKKCGRAIELGQYFAAKGSKVIIADSGSSAILCKAAMQAASLNVYINTSMLKDRALAKKLNEECAARIVYYGAMADVIVGQTTSTLINTVE